MDDPTCLDENTQRMPPLVDALIAGGLMTLPLSSPRRKTAATDFAIYDHRLTLDEMLEQSSLATALFLGIALHPYLVGQPNGFDICAGALSHTRFETRPGMAERQAVLISD